MTSTASTDWPRAYLLQIYADAVRSGIIMLEPISEADASSLKQRLYRLRRRSDKALAPFILPEYHLVTVGKWRDSPAGGVLPIIYNQLPDGKALPAIRPATADELGEALMSPEPQGLILDPEEILANLDSKELTLEPAEIESFVADLMAKAERAKPAKEEPE